MSEQVAAVSGVSAALRHNVSVHRQKKSDLRANVTNEEVAIASLQTLCDVT